MILMDYCQYRQIVGPARGQGVYLDLHQSPQNQRATILSPQLRKTHGIRVRSASHPTILHQVLHYVHLGGRDANLGIP